MKVINESYKPPFVITDLIMNLIIEIGELVGRVSVKNEASINPKLRRANRIKSIHSSLAIEQNTLTLKQVSDIIDGKRILGPPDEIREVKNAYQAYELIQDFDPYDLKDLLMAHKILMAGLVNEAGSFRSRGVGVYAGENLIHAGSPPQYVPGLIKELFEWIKETKVHFLIKSCVFHYEFEFIHPFADGNGRMGRMWHTLLLSKWKSFFAWLPIETLIQERQDDYYKVLNAANSNGESTIFIEFMLEAIRDALMELVANSQEENVGINSGINVGIKISETEEKVIDLLKENPYLTAGEIAKNIEMTQRQIERTIAQLKHKKILERVGARKNGYWQVDSEVLSSRQ